MQHVWLAPRPGWFLGLVWIFFSGSLFSFALGGERPEGSDRLVVVIDPGADPAVVRRIRTQLEDLGRTARIRYWWSRAANACVCAFPAVLILVWGWASTTMDRVTDPLADVAMPVAVTYAAVAVLLSVVCDRYSRRSARQLSEFEAPGVVSSSGLGGDKFVMRMIARAEERTAGEQRQLTELLWRLVHAERARHQYLHSAAVFDEEEFAVVRGRVEDVRRDLGAWAGTTAAA